MKNQSKGGFPTLLLCRNVYNTKTLNQGAKRAVTRCEAKSVKAESNCTALRLRREGAVPTHSSQCTPHHIPETTFMYKSGALPLSLNTTGSISFLFPSSGLEQKEKFVHQEMWFLHNFLTFDQPLTHN